MTEFEDVTAPRVELFHDARESCRRVVEARRKLEKKATETLAEEIRDQPEILDERRRARETFHVRDQLVDLDRVDEIVTRGLSFPRRDRRERGPGIKQRIELDRRERVRVMLEPARARDI